MTPEGVFFCCGRAERDFVNSAKLTRDKMLALRQSVVGPWAAHYVARAKRVD